MAMGENEKLKVSTVDAAKWLELAWQWPSQCEFDLELVLFSTLHLFIVKNKIINLFEN